MRRYHKHLEAALAGYTVEHDGATRSLPYTARDAQGHTIGYCRSPGQAWYEAWYCLQVALRVTGQP